MGIHIVTHSCGHDYEHKLNGNARAREDRVNWLATQLCPACRREARRESAIEALCPDGLPEIGGGTEKQIAWAEKIREKQIAEIYSGFSLESLHFRSVVDVDTLNEDYDKYDAADDMTTEALRDYVQSLFAQRPDAKSWIDNRFKSVNPGEFLRERRKEIKKGLRSEQYERLARKIIAERDARKANAEPDKIAPNGKKRPSKDMNRLLRSGVYVNNATRDFVVVDDREADEDALFLDGYFFCCKLLANDEKINAEIAKFRDASLRAEKAEAMLLTTVARTEYRNRREDGLDVGTSTLMAAIALRKYRYLVAESSDDAISFVNSLARSNVTSQIVAHFRKTGRRVNPYKFADALEALYNHCYFNGVNESLVNSIMPFIALIHNDGSVYDWAAEIIASPKIADFAQKIKELLFGAEFTKHEFRGKYPDLQRLIDKVFASGFCDYIDDAANKMEALQDDQ